MLGVRVNSFYTILDYSLPSCDLQLHVECKYTIVQINTQYNVLVNQVSLNTTLFQLHSSWIQSIRWCDFEHWHSNASSLSLLFMEISDNLPSCCLNLLLRSYFVCISESQDVSCWGCNANSTFLPALFNWGRQVSLWKSYIHKVIENAVGNRKFFINEDSFFF